MLVLAHWGEGSYLCPTMRDVRVESLYQWGGFLLGGGLVWLGIRAQQREVVNTATVFFVVFLYTKLFDWWWDILPKYLFFMLLGGIALLLLFGLKVARQRLVEVQHG